MPSLNFFSVIFESHFVVLGLMLKADLDMPWTSRTSAVISFT